MGSKILAICGSNRPGSFNAKLLGLIAEEIRGTGAEVTELDLFGLGLPIYNPALEAERGLPKEAAELQELFAAHDALLLASPEYNGAMPPVVKNALDWASRPGAPGRGILIFAQKRVALVSASLSPFGGLRGLMSLRNVFSKMGAHVIPDELCVPSAHLNLVAAGFVDDEHRRLAKLLAIRLTA